MTLRMSKPRARRKWGALVVSVAVLLTALGGAALAVHDDGVFELDRNAVDDTGGADGGEDWENIYDGDDTADATPNVWFRDNPKPHPPTFVSQWGPKTDFPGASSNHSGGTVQFVRVDGSVGQMNQGGSWGVWVTINGIADKGTANSPQ